MEYTEQEFNALFEAVMVGASDIERNTPHFRDEIKFSVKLILEGQVGRRANPAPYTLDLPTALRLMRDAREQGAAEMKERAASKAEDGPENRWDGGDIADEIRALPLTVPQ